jgi:hypothetical protein
MHMPTDRVDVVSEPADIGIKPNQTYTAAMLVQMPALAIAVITDLRQPAIRTWPGIDDLHPNTRVSHRAADPHINHDLTTGAPTERMLQRIRTQLRHPTRHPPHRRSHRLTHNPDLNQRATHHPLHPMPGIADTARIIAGIGTARVYRQRDRMGIGDGGVGGHNNPASAAGPNRNTLVLAVIVDDTQAGVTKAPPARGSAASRAARRAASRAIPISCSNSSAESAATSVSQLHVANPCHGVSNNGT